jgi:hypothetical protein
MANTSRELQRRLLSTPFVASWVGDARSGADRFDDIWGRRRAAWAQWAIENLVEMAGANDRTYAAILLEGAFHDPKGRGPLVRPHIEIPQWALDAADPYFGARLAIAGNGLAFPWWLAPECVAVKRALLHVRGADPSAIINELSSQRAALAGAVANLSEAAARHWTTIEQLIIAEPDGLSAEATGNFGPDDVAAVLPSARSLQLEVVYDEKLRASAKSWASRRVGVWQLRGVNADGRRCALGVVTPRLTSNSQFRDPLFAPEREAPGALLVRALLLRRLAGSYLGVDVDDVAATPTSVAPARSAGMHLRAVPAKVGARLPEASVESAMYFLHTHPEPDQAWAALCEWATRTRTLLTVSEEGFAAAHRRSMRFLRRAEEPERDDVNVVLPLGWDEQNRVVRVSFSRPPADS